MSNPGFYHNQYGRRAPFTSKWLRTADEVSDDADITSLLSRVEALETLVADQQDEIDDLQARVASLEGAVIIVDSFQFVRVGNFLQLRCKVSEAPVEWRVIAVWRCPETVEPFEPDPLDPLEPQTP